VRILLLPPFSLVAARGCIFSNNGRYSFWGHVDAVTVLLAAGAAVNSQTLSGSTALHGATRQGNPEMVQLLLRHGADVHICNKHGDTPLYYACRHEKHDVARLLLEAGADPVGSFVGFLDSL
jgi:ankyrin repeat protein